VMLALRLAYDSAHHPEPALREDSSRMLVAVLKQVEASPVLRHAVASLVVDHLRSFAGHRG
jgi:hypothetical protein